MKYGEGEVTDFLCMCVCVCVGMVGGAVESHSGMQLGKYLFNIHIAAYVIECAIKNSLYALLIGKRTVPALLFAGDIDI